MLNSATPYPETIISDQNPDMRNTENILMKKNPVFKVIKLKSSYFFFVSQVQKSAEHFCIDLKKKVKY